ncbi:MAG: outer membrane protein assembly factor BamD [Gemmatimonadota bacterium]|jgi:outer membrane protein assembly factor BamD
MSKGYGKAAIGLLLVALLGGCASAPRYEGMEPEELFALAARAFDDEDWDEATQAFERLIFTEPTYERVVEARMYLARAYYNKGEYITAISEFTRIVDRHPGHQLAPEASLGICQCYAAQSPHIQRDQTLTGQAWTACQNTAIDFRGTEVAARAEEIRDQMEDKLAHKIYSYGDFYYRRNLLPSGIIYFNDVLERYPESRWTANALLRLYQSYSSLEWDTEAEEAKERLLREFPDSEAAKEIGANGGGGGDGGEGTA